MSLVFVGSSPARAAATPHASAASAANVATAIEPYRFIKTSPSRKNTEGISMRLKRTQLNCVPHCRTLTTSRRGSQSRAARIRRRRPEQRRTPDGQEVISMETSVQSHRPLPRLNEPAPDFEAVSTHGPIKLSNFRGKWVVLFSHPADFTPVCTTELTEFARRQEEFQKLNAQLVGL